jgi:hypothetical protein
LQFPHRQDFARSIREFGLAQGLSDALTARQEKRIGHAAADKQIVDLAHEIAQELEFGRDLGAADDCRERVFRISQLRLSFSSSSCILCPSCPQPQ